MATVRFSQELKDAILKNAKAVFDKQIHIAQESRPSNDWADKIYNTLFGEHIPALNAVPQDFLYMVDKIEVDKVGDINCGLQFTLPSKRAWVREFSESEYAKRNSSYGNGIALKNHLAWGELFAEVKAWKDRIAEAQRKRDEFVAAVDKVINAHATLAPALKMWQPLWDLVPETYKDRHREVVERTKKDVAVDVDLQSLTATVVAHKLTR